MECSQVSSSFVFADSLHTHCRNNLGPIFLHLDLWMHSIIASQHLTGNLWRNAVRTIGDILVLADIINPHAYYALPFTNQAFFVASCCHLKGEPRYSLAERYRL